MNFEEYNSDAVELIKDGYDLHVHTSPSHFKRSLDDFEMIRDADRFKMSGILIKSHYEGTQARAILANKYAGTKAKLYGTTTLNWPLGGINPYAVESALNMGARIIFMPTRDSKNSLQYGDMPGDFFTRPPISIYDESLKIKKSVYEVLEVVKKYNASIATGHLSTKESIDLCVEAHKMNIKTILTHPDWERTIMPLDQQIELVKKGVMIEKVWLNIIEGTITAEEMALSIKKIGSENIFMTTDRGQFNSERPVEGMLRFIKCMLNQGITEKDIKNMIHYVPVAILE